VPEPADAQPFAADGGPVGVVLSHGFTGTPASMRPWAEQAYDEVAARCDTVFAAGLSMGATLVTRLAEEKGDRIAGLVLVNPAYSTDRKDAKLAPYISWAVRSRPSIGGDVKKPGIVEPAYDRTPVVAFASLLKLWRVTAADLGTVSAPIRMYRSVEDHVVDPSSAALLKARATGTSVEEILLHDSYHVATLDNEAQQIFEGSVQFIRSLSGAGAPTP
jgi:carboxylesterase